MEINKNPYDNIQDLATDLLFTQSDDKPLFTFLQ